MNILFLCSPGLGSLDNWLPIIKELKKKNYNLDFYVPKESILDQIETNIFFSFKKLEHTRWFRQLNFCTLKHLSICA